MSVLTSKRNRADVESAASSASHLSETLRLALPISMGHLSYLAVTTATLVLLGWHSADALAAGGLAIRIAVSTNILAGVLVVVGVMMSEAQGEGNGGRLARAYGDGLFLAGVLSVVSFAWMSASPSVLALLGQDPKVVADAKAFLDILRWAEPGNMIRLGLMRAALPVLGLAPILYVLTPLTLGLYIGLALALMSGAFGLPRADWLGVPIAFVVVSTLSAIVMLVVVHLGPRKRLVHIRPGPLRGQWDLFRRGVPIGALMAVDGVYYLVITLLIGRFGSAMLAAHQVVLNFGTIAWVLASSFGDAGALRISFRRGARRLEDSWRAGFVACWLGIVSMAAVSLAVVAFPLAFINIFIDVSAPANAETVVIALVLAPLAAAFIFADGFYGVGMGVLRGIDDNRFTMMATAACYWGLGLPLCYLLAFPLGLGGAGIWMGLVFGVLLVGCILLARYWWRSLEGERRGERLLAPSEEPA